MAEEVLKVTRHPNYAVLTLNRPEKRNALNQPLIDAFDQVTWMANRRKNLSS